MSSAGNQQDNFTGNNSQNNVDNNDQKAVSSNITYPNSNISSSTVIPDIYSDRTDNSSNPINMISTIDLERKISQIENRTFSLLPVLEAMDFSEDNEAFSFGSIEKSSKEPRGASTNSTVKLVESAIQPKFLNNLELDEGVGLDLLIFKDLNEDNYRFNLRRNLTLRINNVRNFLGRRERLTYATSLQLGYILTNKILYGLKYSDRMENIIATITLELIKVI